MKIPAKTANAIFEEVNKAENILIISHRNPDADTIGSNFALRLFLEDLGKKVDSACIDKNPYNCTFLFKPFPIISEFNFKNYDLIFIVDCGSSEQSAFIKKYPAMKNSKNIPIINIDHHPSNDNFGTINLVLEYAASTTAIIYYLLINWDIEITPQIASCLLFGLYYDTGSFMHSNTNDDIYHIAGELLKAGAAHEKIMTILYKEKTQEKLRLWGKVLSNIKYTDKQVVISGVKKKDYEECNAKSDDLSGIIDYLSTVKGNQFATLLSEDGEGNIKGSLRTRSDNVDVSKIAKKLGGGGHKKASGFTLKGSLKKENIIKVKTADNVNS